LLAGTEQQGELALADYWLAQIDGPALILTVGIDD
jgi:hypothetical protein